MDDSLGLSPAQAQLADSSLKRLLHPASRETVLHLVGRWKKTVSEVECGYRLTLYDYENDLGVRSILETLVQSVPVEIADRIREALESLDRRFNAATEPYPPGLLPRSVTHEEWWYFRKPLILGGELIKDWKSE